MTVKIYDAAGGLVKTIVQEGGFENNETNTVTWDGMADPIPPADPEPAPKGIYTYTVEAVHNVPMLLECRDTDKVDPPTLGVTLSATQPTYVAQGLWDVAFTVSYSVATRPATDGTIDIYDAAFTKIASLQVDPNGNGQIPVGTYNEANGKALHIELDDIPFDNLGTFTVAFWAKETDGSANRDGQAKWARPGMGTAWAVRLFLTSVQFKHLLRGQEGRGWHRLLGDALARRQHQSARQRRGAGRPERQSPGPQIPRLLRRREQGEGRGDDEGARPRV